MHRDDLAGRGQDVVGDLFQVLLLIEYEIVYETLWTGNRGASTPFAGMFAGAFAGTIWRTCNLRHI